MSLKELGDAVFSGKDIIATTATSKLEEDLTKMKGWRDTTNDRLEKMVWSDLVKFIEEELKKREQKV